MPEYFSWLILVNILDKLSIGGTGCCFFSTGTRGSHCTCRPRASSSVLQAAAALACGRCGSEGYAPPLRRRTAVRRGAAQDGAE
uniref:Uncharacterized protein n=1 Tax=Arundo donax TaxID=35708 RepID=A0A0A9G6H5_ARUDO